MVQRIGGAPSPAELPIDDVRLRNLAKEIQKHLGIFIEDTRKAIASPHLIDNPGFLDHFAQTIIQLSNPVNEAARLGEK